MPVIDRVDVAGRLLVFRFGAPGISVQKCSCCGCTDADACVTSSGPCWWVAVDLCSACYQDGA